MSSHSITLHRKRENFFLQGQKLILFGSDILLWSRCKVSVLIIVRHQRNYRWLQWCDVTFDKKSLKYYRQLVESLVTAGGSWENHDYQFSRTVCKIRILLPSNLWIIEVCSRFNCTKVQIYRIMMRSNIKLGYDTCACINDLWSCCIFCSFFWLFAIIS